MFIHGIFLVGKVNLCYNKICIQICMNRKYIYKFIYLFSVLNEFDPEYRLTGLFSYFQEVILISFNVVKLTQNHKAFLSHIYLSKIVSTHLNIHTIYLLGFSGINLHHVCKLNRSHEVAHFMCKLTSATT